jgi:hypothetical protein
MESRGAFSSKPPALPRRSRCLADRTTICVCQPQTRRIPARDLWIFHANPVHAVNDQQYTILFVAAAVYFRQVSAIRAIGSRTPLLECTQVTPTARVFGPIALRMRSAISSGEIES